MDKPLDTSVVPGEEMERYRKQRELFTCPECGQVADVRLTIRGEQPATTLWKRWAAVHTESSEDGKSHVYIHVDADEVDRGAELRRLVAEHTEDPDPDPHRNPHGEDGPEGFQKAHIRERGDPRTDGGEPEPRVPATVADGAHAQVHESERCDGAGDGECVRMDPELTRGEDAIHVTHYGPIHSQSGRRVLCGECRDKQTALNIARDPEIGLMYADELETLRSKFPDILGDVDVPATDGGRAWSEQYATTTYRGPQQYPVPGGWVLGVVEGDGIGWKHYPDVGEELSHQREVLETTDRTDYTEGLNARATLILDYPEGADALEDPPFHELKIDGELAMVLKDASQVPEHEWWTAVAETLARYDSGGEYETVLSDMGLEHLKADPFGAVDGPEDRDADHELDEFATDGGVQEPSDAASEWEQKAHANVQKWGLQPVDALTLAMGEEMGEFASDVLAAHEFTGEPGLRAEQGRDLLRRMESLGDEIRDFLETASEDDDGEPLPEDERAAYLTRTNETAANIWDRKARDELDDLMALGFQTLWAMEAGADGGGE